ncbi:hypothetical protein Kpol_1031p37 [Vanderwaltozyma polyspora DSM 70294]|uniref:DASH complex subunit SPC34 n=1 Tax=Vanderwaltozyma polyspora (strain ATCC 22028 / DSM 70294 / BCRC 21397 / CBS 2163 / NBRC 10782 / NRRL Y-8283 / UCD 57-17) TaxID=436907 RepID=A7THX1_VANPO|nr:uncharacterized protein Kpol_1031p37 [Vanderwaltozyma polyspora DSM 70294]EDO18133.1 hypothetical protein Kpol_1031p37 [Vanderwaltozyma polyspora DSM 70294]
MSDSLDQLIKDIDGSVQSIVSLDFKPPGIFHNAISHSNHDFSDLLEKLIKDVDNEKEAPLYKLDQVNKIPTRKDGKKGVLDYLTERNLGLKRNRHLGLPEEQPIIHIANDYYNKLENERSNKRSKLSRNSILLDVDAVASSVITGASSAALDILSWKFKDDKNSTQLLSALKNGTVITDNETNRRRTMFVEDFPPESMLNVLQEISKTWPSDSYQQEYEKFLNSYNEIQSKMDAVRKEIRLQEDQLDAQAISESNSSSNIVRRLIEKEQKDIRNLQQQIEMTKQ